MSHMMAAREKRRLGFVSPLCLLILACLPAYSNPFSISPSVKPLRQRCATGVGREVRRDERTPPPHSRKSDDPFWEEEFSDQFAFGGDIACISLYTYTQAAVDFAVKSVDLDDLNPDRLLQNGFTGVLGALDEPFLNHPARTVVVCAATWTVAGLFTNAFRRETSRQSTDLSLLLALRTWLVFAPLLLGFLQLNHVTITSSDAIFVGGSLSVMSVWRFLFSGLSPFLP